MGLCECLRSDISLMIPPPDRHAQGQFLRNTKPCVEDAKVTPKRESGHWANFFLLILQWLFIFISPLAKFAPHVCGLLMSCDPAGQTGFMWTMLQPAGVADTKVHGLYTWFSLNIYLRDHFHFFFAFCTQHCRYEVTLKFLQMSGMYLPTGTTGILQTSPP